MDDYKGDTGDKIKKCVGIRKEIIEFSALIAVYFIHSKEYTGEDVDKKNRFGYIIRNLKNVPFLVDFLSTLSGRSTAVDVEEIKQSSHALKI